MPRTRSTQHPPRSFGEVVSRLREQRGLSQKELAARLVKEDGSPISPQYLNDIERDRRQPPGSLLLGQMARHLGVTLDALEVMAGRIPESLQGLRFEDPKRIDRAVGAFNRAFSPRGERGAS